MTKNTHKAYETSTTPSRERRLARRSEERRLEAESNHTSRVTGIAGAGMKPSIERSPAMPAVRDPSFEKELKVASGIPDFLFYWGPKGLGNAGLNISEATRGTNLHHVVMSDKPFAAAEMARVFDLQRADEAAEFVCYRVRTSGLKGAFCAVPSTVTGAREFYCNSDLIETRLQSVFRLSRLSDVLRNEIHSAA